MPSGCKKVADSFVTGPGGVFFDRQVQVVYNSTRRVTLAASCEGDPMAVDDKLTVTNTRNGRKFEHDYSNGCTGTITNTTHDITALLDDGANTLRFQGEDICGQGDSGITDIYIVGVDEQTCDRAAEPGNGGREIVGGPRDDTLLGTDGDDVICGLGGSDVIRGGGGNDAIYGGAGNDLLLGNGHDLLRGEGGNDTLGNPFRGVGDTFVGGPGKDTVTYLPGTDLGDRTTGVTAKIGGVGGDGEGDSITPSIEVLVGTKFRDTLIGDGARNTLVGDRGTDRLRGKGGNDKLEGGLGGDIMEGGSGDDTLRGGRAEDDLFGEGGLDRLFGEQGDDNLFAKDRRIDRVLSGGPGTGDFAEYDRRERRKLRSIELR